MEKIMPGEFIFRAGEPADQFIILDSGRVLLTRLGQKREYSKKAIIDVVDGVSFVGWEAFDKDNTYLNSAEAFTECQISRIHRDNLPGLVTDDLEMALDLMLVLTKTNRRREEHISNKRDQNTQEKLLLEAIEVFHHEDPKIGNVTQSMLGQYADLTRPDVNKIFKRLIRRGVTV